MTRRMKAEGEGTYWETNIWEEVVSSFTGPRAGAYHSNRYITVIIYC
jgi:hypothetical protein